MSTLFQIHGNMHNLKSLIKETALLWQAGDSLLLLGETAAYIDWINAYINDLNSDDEFEYNLYDIAAIYILTKDINTVNESAKINLDFTKIDLAPIKQISDTDWVLLTQQMNKVITLSSVT